MDLCTFVGQDFCQVLSFLGGERVKIIPDNAQALGTRERQEDSFAFSNFDDPKLIKERGYVAIVADGMGGLSWGKEASETVVQSFLDSYQNITPFEDIIHLLQVSLQNANDMVRNMAIEKGKVNQTGTTLAAAAILEDSLYWISVGDSRIYLYRDSELIQLTEDHQYSKLLYEEVMKENITKEEADSHPQKNALISFLGLSSLPEIDFNVQAFKLNEGDTILLCSDGLHGFISDEEIAAVLMEHRPYAAHPLTNVALKKKHPYQDNITVATLTCMEESSTPASAPNGSKETSLTKNGKWTIIIPVLLIFIIGISLILVIQNTEYEKWRTLFQKEEPITHENGRKEGDNR